MSRHKPHIARRGRHQGHQVERTEIFNGLKLGNPSSTGETETKSEGLEHRYTGNMGLSRQGPGYAGLQSSIKTSGLYYKRTSEKVLEGYDTIILEKCFSEGRSASRKLFPKLSFNLLHSTHQ